MRPLKTLQRAQRDRILEALVAGFALELAQLAEAEGVGGVIATPEPEHFYIVETAQTLDLALNGPVAVLISPTRETVYSQRLSGNGLRGSTLTESFLTVSVLFSSPAGYALVERRGRRLVESELVSMFSSLYSGALLEVLMRDATDGEVILDIFPTRDYADSITSDELGTVGRALVEFTVKGQGAHPHPSYQLARQAP